MKTHTIDKKMFDHFTFRLMASYSMILLVLLSLGFYLYTLSIKNIKTEIRRQNRATLVNSVNQLNSNLNFLSSLPRQIANNSDLVHLANMTSTSESTFYLSAYKVKSWLTSLIPSYSQLPIDTYFIHLRNTDYILSFEYFEPLQYYYTNDRHLNAELFDAWKEALENPQNLYSFLPIAPYSELYSVDPHNYYYIMSLEDFAFRMIPADVCIELDMERIQNIFAGLNLYHDGYIIAATNDSEMIFSISSNEIQAIDPKALSLLSGLPYDSHGFSSYRDSGVDMLVTKLQSEYNYWDFYLVQPANDVFRSLNSFQLIAIVSINLSLFLGFALIVFLSKKNSRPLTDMNSELIRSNAKQQELLDLSKQQEPILRTSYIQKILNGNITSSDEMTYIRDYLKFPVRDTVHYQVLYCTIYINKYEINTDTPNLVDIATPNYDDVIYEAFSSFLQDPMYFYKTQEHSYAILLCLDVHMDKEQARSSILHDFLLLHEYLQEHHSIWIFAGIGTREQHLSFSWKSYQRAKEAIRYTTREQVFCFYELLKPDTHVYYFPSELAQQLSNFLLSGNQKQTIEIFQVIKHENLKKRSLSARQMNWLLSDIRNSLLKVRFSLNNTQASPDVLENLDIRFEEMPSLKLFEDLALELCGFFHTDTSENQMITDIKTYISQNYQDPSLCLSRISDEFSISESYFSYLFKKTTGENFSVYLEKLRMERAIYLLKNTNIKISALYEELGYNNITSFRRAFKKNFGITPNSVREQEKH